MPALDTSGLDLDRLPRHVAVIMDGNGRWAQRRGLSRIEGHRRGKDSVRAVVETARRLGIPYLSLFAFSTENWQRPRREVDALMRLLLRYLRTELQQDDEERGARAARSATSRACRSRCSRELERGHRATRDNQRLTVGLCVSYGGREDIVEATRAHRARDVRAGALDPEDDRRGDVRRLRSAPPAFPIPICSSAPAARCASPISSCGRSPTPRSTSPRPCGRISARRSSSTRSRIPAARAPLRPHQRAAAGKGTRRVLRARLATAAVAIPALLAADLPRPRLGAGGCSSWSVAMLGSGRVPVAGVSGARRRARPRPACSAPLVIGAALSTPRPGRSSPRRSSLLVAGGLIYVVLLRGPTSSAVCRPRRARRRRASTSGFCCRTSTGCTRCPTGPQWVIFVIAIGMGGDTAGTSSATPSAATS